jgi:hypothetical protein
MARSRGLGDVYKRQVGKALHLRALHTIAAIKTQPPTLPPTKNQYHNHASVV